MPYKLSKTDGAVQLFVYYWKDPHIHTAACTTAGIVPHPDTATSHRFPPKQPAKMRLSAPSPKPSALATERGKGGVSRGAAALRYGW